MYATPSLDMSHEDGKPIVVVSTSLDSRGLFHDIVLGVDNGVSGTVALLAVADALSNVSDKFCSSPSGNKKFLLMTG